MVPEVYALISTTIDKRYFPLSPLEMYHKTSVAQGTYEDMSVVSVYFIPQK